MSGTLRSWAQSLGTFKEEVQKSANERLLNINKKISTATSAKGEPLFTAATQTRINQLMSQYKIDLDPRVSRSGINQIRGNRLFDRSDINGSNEAFTRLQTLDTYKVSLQAKYLKGLVPSRIPLMPMIFNVILPEIAQSQNFNSPPPFFLFVNPTNWSRSNNKVQNNNYVRNGIKTERWGEELEQITASGSIGGFYTQETGLTRTYRRQTPSFTNLMNLIQIYRNNGCLYGNSYEGSEDAPSTNRRILDVGYIEILYGFELFRGTFDSFSITESVDKPFTLEYTFTFNVSESVSIHDITSSNTNIQNFKSSSVRLVPNQSNVEQSAFLEQQNRISRQNFLSTIANNTQESIRLQNLANSNNNGKPYQFGQQTSGGVATLTKRIQQR